MILSPIISFFPRLAIGLLLGTGILTAQSNALSDALPQRQWDVIEKRVDLALDWLSRKQKPDGSYHSGHVNGQPAVTSFAIMAYLSRGHLPGKGPYGEQLNRALDFVLTCQQPEGVLNKQPIIYGEAPRDREKPQKVAHTATYNHSITLLMLAEVYGLLSDDRSPQVKLAMERGLQFTYQQQDRKKPNEVDEGGWRYLYDHHDSRDSDLSVTGWHLMSLRAAKNAGFDIPKERIDRVVAYVRRCYDVRRRDFSYISGKYHEKPAMTGAGALSLALSGKHNDSQLKAVARTLERINFERELTWPSNRHKFGIYACYYCSQAAAQIGGRCWKNTYRNISSALLKTQKRDGRWNNVWRGRWVGNSYSTALGVLSLTTPYQLLPIYQR